MDLEKLREIGLELECIIAELRTLQKTMAKIYKELAETP